MLKQTISDLIKRAIIEAQAKGKLTIPSVPEIIIERPQKPEPATETPG